METKVWHEICNLFCELWIIFALRCILFWSVLLINIVLCYWITYKDSMHSDNTSFAFRRAWDYIRYGRICLFHRITHTLLIFDRPSPTPSCWTTLLQQDSDIQANSVLSLPFSFSCFITEEEDIWDQIDCVCVCGRGGYGRGCMWVFPILLYFVEWNQKTFGISEAQKMEMNVHATVPVCHILVHTGASCC